MCFERRPVKDCLFDDVEALGREVSTLKSWLRRVGRRKNVP